MYSKALLALAAAGAVQASPLVARQASSISSVASAVESIVATSASSAASSAAAAVTSAPAAASSIASDATSSAASATSAVSSMVSSVASGASSMATDAAAAATTTGMNMTGGQIFPNYPCPTGTLLTYVSLNQTFPVPITMLTAAAGEYASSPFFPNVTNAMGGSAVGAMHTINIDAASISIPEVLVSVTSNDTSGYLQWTWNNTASASTLGVTLANYSSVLQMYDPDYTTTQMIGNSSIAVLFTNACVSNQDMGMTLLNTLGGLELGNLALAVGGNSTMSGASTTAAAVATDAMMTASMVSSMASNSVMSASSMASSAVSGATSSAASAAGAATSAPASAASSATSAVQSATSAVSSEIASAVSAAVSTSA